MRVLVADDDPLMLRLLSGLLARDGYEMLLATNGTDALETLVHEPALVALVDWMMPGLSGPDVCRRARSQTPERHYIIMLTAREAPVDMVDALDAGADDYLVKPVQVDVLAARVRAGARFLTGRRPETPAATDPGALVPICSYCNAVRDAWNQWGPARSEGEISPGMRLTHGVCPACYSRLIAPELERRAARRSSDSSGGS